MGSKLIKVALDDARGVAFEHFPHSQRVNDPVAELSAFSFIPFTQQGLFLRLCEVANIVLEVKRFAVHNRAVDVVKL